MNPFQSQQVIPQKATTNYGPELYRSSGFVVQKGGMKARALSEDRAAHRRHVKQRAVAILRPGVEIECTVVDTSETGARLRFRSGVILPKKFVVYLADAGREIGVTVVWQKATLAGVRYAERLPEPKARRGFLRF